MLCQKCKQREATRHIRSVVDGVVNDSYLCEKCAESLKVTDIYGSELFKILSSLIDTKEQILRAAIAAVSASMKYREQAGSAARGAINFLKSSCVLPLQRSTAPQPTQARCRKDPKGVRKALPTLKISR